MSDQTIRTKINEQGQPIPLAEDILMEILKTLQHIEKLIQDLRLGDC